MRHEIREIAKVIADALKPDQDPLQAIPENVKRFPDKEIGDRLYVLRELVDGVEEYVILWKTTDGICVVIEMRTDPMHCRGFYPRAQYATERFYASLKDIAHEYASFDLGYYKRLLARTKQAIKLIKASKDDNRLVQQLNELGDP